MTLSLPVSFLLSYLCHFLPFSNCSSTVGCLSIYYLDNDLIIKLLFLCAINSEVAPNIFCNQDMSRAVIQVASEGVIYASNKFLAGQTFLADCSRTMTRAGASLQRYLPCPAVVPQRHQLKRCALDTGVIEVTTYLIG